MRSKAFGTLFYTTQKFFRREAKLAPERQDTALPQGWLITINAAGTVDCLNFITIPLNFTTAVCAAFLNFDLLFIF